jgi:hypothetical protein
MEYEMISSIEKIEIINERITNLEKHIFHNEMLILEHENINIFDEEGLLAINMENNLYAQQILVLKTLRNSI